MDEVHIVFTIATLLVLILQWWVTFKWNNEVNWSFDKFLVLIVWTISLYMLTVFLYPPDLSEAEEHRARFHGTGPDIIPRSSPCVCWTSRKRQFAATFFIRFGMFRSSLSTRFWLAVALLSTGAVTIDSSHGTN